MTARKRDIIVIGGSAGGVEAVQRLVRALPGNLPASLFVVIHIPPQSPSFLPDVLRRSTSLGVRDKIQDGESIRKGCIYVAPPDLHLVVEKNCVRLVRGPRENRHRPAIDVLFRSAAGAYQERVIGVILSGTLDDGTAGLLAVKSRGGTTVVQDPKDAQYAEMPANAADQVKPDYVAPLVQLGPLLVKLVRKPSRKSVSGRVPAHFHIETDVAEMKKPENQMEHLGVPSVFACPECHGVLWELKEGGMQRFRCRVGHAFSLESLRSEMTHSLEEALWSAVRSLEEKTALLTRMANEARGRGHGLVARRFASRANELVPAVKAIRGILLKPDK